MFIYKLRISKNILYVTSPLKNKKMFYLSDISRLKLIGFQPNARQRKNINMR